MPITDWLDLCVQTVVWQPMINRDAYGEPQYGPPQTFRGRRVFKLTRVPSKGGDPDALSQSTIWILGIPAVGYEDNVFVQGDLPPYPIVMNVLRYPDENGDLFVKVLMGSAG
jgi:hypothetical protein